MLIICVLTVLVKSVISGIYVVDTGEYVQAKCTDYIDNKNNRQGYIKNIKRTAKQKKPLMGFSQNY